VRCIARTIQKVGLKQGWQDVVISGPQIICENTDERSDLLTYQDNGTYLLSHLM
jgi:hypothetical protein